MGGSSPRQSIFCPLCNRPRLITRPLHCSLVLRLIIASCLVGVVMTSHPQRRHISVFRKRRADVFKYIKLRVFANTIERLREKIIQRAVWPGSHIAAREDSNPQIEKIIQRAVWTGSHIAAREDSNGQIKINWNYLTVERYSHVYRDWHFPSRVHILPYAGTRHISLMISKGWDMGACRESAPRVRMYASTKLAKLYWKQRAKAILNNNRKRVTNNFSQRLATKEPVDVRLIIEVISLRTTL